MDDIRIQSQTVRLDVRIAREAWREKFGTDPAEEFATVGEQVARAARYAVRLVALLPPASRAAGAQVGVLDARVVAHPATDRRGWVSGRVLLSVPLDVPAYRQRWQADPLASLPPHLASVVSRSSVLLHETRAAVPTAEEAEGLPR